jgi:aspartate/methionine/tyrosine aminotransferase
MTDPAANINRAIEEAAPPLSAALSPLGRRVVLPFGIPSQAAEARGKTLNGTIGQITDGRGDPLPLPSMSETLPGLVADDRRRAFLYSPVQGIDEMRRMWREWQRRQVPPELPSSLPLLTVGLTHGLSLVADLFTDETRAVALAEPFWGNYGQTFAVRRGARMLTAPAYVEGRYNATAVAQVLSSLPAGEPALAIVNAPSNPGGYSPWPEERQALCESLVEAAGQRPLLVVCDDAYAGLVYEDEISRASLFWDLIGRHENLVPIKVDGSTKEFCFFGGRVGFLTFPFAPDSAVAQALESKVKCLVRSTVGSPVATSQMILLQALRHGGIDQEVERVRRVLAERYRALKQALEGCDRRLLQPLPFNSGAFSLVELPEELGLTAEQVRQHLLAHHDTGLVAVSPKHLRIAFCSVDTAALPELVRRMEQAVAELAGRTAP